MSNGYEVLLDGQAIARIVRRMAYEIIERTRTIERLGLVGVRRGGVPIARRIAAELLRAEDRAVPVGTVDIALYRDDAATALPDPKIGPSDVSFDVDGWDIVVVDDVLHTGRTARAAIECLLDYGRPRRVWLGVLCDRGGRELPIAPDFVGRSVDVPEGRMLNVVLDSATPDRAVVEWQGGSPGASGD
ncbi:MAG: bifunctional pyr operon transcriptional regulator/uracil phosphoribosyltransferase PyrR [Proteobacteria bacterium]|nr:bifunctional pyr operon transcriptional regulator/uracil phosphoribosyltransferase PyrR [Pseudomonadota bacterium]